MHVPFSHVPAVVTTGTLCPPCTPCIPSARPAPLCTASAPPRPSSFHEAPSDLAQISPLKTSDLKHAEADFGLLSPGQSLTPHLGESPARKQGDAWPKE